MSENNQTRLSGFDRTLLAANTVATAANAAATHRAAQEMQALRAIQEEQLNERRAEKAASETVDRIYRDVEALQSARFPSAEYRAFYKAIPYLNALSAVDSTHLVETEAKDRKRWAESKLRQWVAEADAGTLKEFEWALNVGIATWQQIYRKAGLHRILAEGANGEFFPTRQSAAAKFYAFITLVGVLAYYIWAIRPVQDEFSAWLLPIVVLAVPYVVWTLSGKSQKLAPEWETAKAKVIELTKSPESYCSGDLEDPAKLEAQANTLAQRINAVHKAVGVESGIVILEVEGSEADRLAQLKRLAIEHNRYAARGIYAGLAATALLVVAAVLIRPVYKAVAAAPSAHSMNSQAEFLQWDSKARSLGLFHAATTLERFRSNYLTNIATNLRLDPSLRFTPFTDSGARERIEALNSLVIQKGPGVLAETQKEVAETADKLARWPLEDAVNGYLKATMSHDHALLVATELHPFMDTDALTASAAELLSIRRQLLEKACEALGLPREGLRSLVSGGEPAMLNVLTKTAERNRIAAERMRAEEARRKIADQKAAKAKEAQVNRQFIEAWMFLRLSAAWHDPRNTDITALFQSFRAECESANLAATLGLSREQFEGILASSVRAYVAPTGKVTLNGGYVAMLRSSTVGYDFLKISLARSPQGLDLPASEVLAMIGSGNGSVAALVAKAYDTYAPTGYSHLSKTFDDRIARFLKDVHRDRPGLDADSVRALVANEAKSWPEYRQLSTAYPNRINIADEVASVMQAQAGAR